MQKLHTSFLTLILICSCLFSATAFAQTETGYIQPISTEETTYTEPGYIQAVTSEQTNEVYYKPKRVVNPTGFDLRAAITVPTFLTRRYTGVGPGLALQMAYRGGTYGVGVEQQLNFLLPLERGDDAAFLGATYFIVKEYIRMGDNAIFTFTEGIGAAYAGNDILDEASVALSFKFDLGFSYFIQSKYGIGLTLEYTAIFPYYESLGLCHVFTPMLTYEMIF